jgi:hypothetical protein
MENLDDENLLADPERNVHRGPLSFRLRFSTRQTGEHRRTRQSVRDSPCRPGET